MKESSCSFDDNIVYESTCDILWQCMYHVCLIFICRSSYITLFSFADHPI